MISFKYPGNDSLTLEHLVLDVNGTIAKDGKLLAGIPERIQKLSEKLKIHILTADTHGKQSEIDSILSIKGLRISPKNEAQQKMNYVLDLGKENTVAIGNGANDSLMIKSAHLGIVVIGNEGAAIETLINSDIVCTNIFDALDLLLNSKRIVATLRK